MNWYIVLTLWPVIGLLTTAVVIAVDWYRGHDVLVKDAVLLVITMLIMGPIGTIGWCIAWAKHFKLGEKILLKGRTSAKVLRSLKGD